MNSEKEKREVEVQLSINYFCSTSVKERADIEKIVSELGMALVMRMIEFRKQHEDWFPL
jgi:hypothetical protein